MTQEIVAIVDEKDMVIGSKLREHLCDDDRWRVAAILLVNEKDEILLSQRSANKKMAPLKWGPSASGTLVLDEDYCTAIVRETEEELGYLPQDLKLLLKVGYKAETGHRYVSYYCAECNWSIDDFKRQEEEVAQYIWISVPQFMDWARKAPEEFVTGVYVLIWAAQAIQGLSVGSKGQVHRP